MTPPAAATAPAVHPRRPLAPRGPRRVSGPVRRPVPARPARSRRTGGQAGFVFGLISALESLAQHRLLDRLIRGRTWIGIVAFALIGIVTLQLGLLKLNGGIGRTLEHEALLQRENAALSIENSELAAGTRVQARAAQLGMAFVPSGQLRFLSASSRGDAAKAASALSSQPNATASEAAAGTGESQAGTESPTAQSASTQASGGEVAGESEASSGQSSEAASGESSSSSDSSSASEPTSSGESGTPATSEAESSSGAGAQAGPGGGVQASTAGG
ncbi:MAG: hypothetical protein QOC91_607 [Solirubrobacteraceae bacterium]|nr:hypothetical protein [Solirubrobacteraceae bacterium]